MFTIKNVLVLLALTVAHVPANLDATHKKNKGPKQHTSPTKSSKELDEKQKTLQEKLRLQNQAFREYMTALEAENEDLTVDTKDQQEITKLKNSYEKTTEQVIRAQTEVKKAQNTFDAAGASRAAKTETKSEKSKQGDRQRLQQKRTNHRISR